MDLIFLGCVPRWVLPGVGTMRDQQEQVLAGRCFFGGSKLLFPTTY
jgi:hypothetical protein